MARFGAFEFGEDVFSGAPSMSDPAEGRISWWLRDLSSDDEYEFLINPAEVRITSPQKPVTTQYTTYGRPIDFTGLQKPSRLSVSGTLFTETHYRAMEEWFDKKKQIQVQDDLNRRFMVYIVSFNPRRRYNKKYPWMHDYDLEGVGISWQ